ncbi:hypothetical protein EPUS_00277 [Endocarpon pusillum Z07020]|uniref:Heterokaryon incompatibility domain-containing protein n=1 Tax=Endocarpon pusillum (strain Z07020 / HMAS-L-300199) TaxID=1263415 RepID=U1HIR1_ENDPU|nr:uncharacterized protein EPUS_00277 [Endocarpon pusillum Z07020]ERF70090.1 hypothetical protein EPUS_00277 [Endocarpon pusillum Z07020]
MIDYCSIELLWGTSTVLKTTKVNLSDHLTLIPVHLGVGSLCIIQQDAEDFAEQSCQIGNIYTSAASVISADSGQGVEAGFLKETFYALTTIRIPTWKRQAHSTDCVFAKPIPNLVKDGINDDQRDEHTSFHSDPTFNRAWCFQEQRMATRIVHFTTNEMYWACASQLTCECERLAWTDYRNDPQLLQRYSNALEPTSGGTMSPPSAVEFWWSFVETFSQRRLTRLTDRLPAISALAKFMHRHFSNLQSTSCERSKVHNIVNSWESRVKRVSKHRLVSVTDRPVPAIPGLAKVTHSEELGECHAGLWERQLAIALLWRTYDLVDPEDYPWKPLEYGPT